MPVIGFIVAVIGSAIYGAVAGIGLLVISQLHGSPGWTGLEVLAVPLFAIAAAIAGMTAAVTSLCVPRTSLRWSDSFALLVAAAIVLQTLVSFGPFLLAPVLPQNDIISLISLGFAASSPFDWFKGGFNRNWLFTLPATLAICSSWFRARFDG